MPMTLVFKRSKSFVSPSENGKGTKKFLAQAAPANPIPVPFWVAETDTFKHGIKDGSIVNLTPPHLIPGYKHPAPEAPPSDDPSEAAEETSQADPDPAPDEEDVEQSKKPEAPFGAQPMTPVSPAAKVGQVRRTGK